MKTREVIKLKGLSLFNELGVQNITLREVAKQLNKSYGNITYYFSTREELISELYSDMNVELSQLALLQDDKKSLLKFFLQAPEYSFDITVKYLFFYKDYIELKRNYPAFIKRVDVLNYKKKEDWLGLMFVLQKQGHLKTNLSTNDLEYIIELSISVRMYYFQSHEWNSLNKKQFVEKVNKLLYPYLSDEGKIVFNSYYNS